MIHHFINKKAIHNKFNKKKYWQVAREEYKVKNLKNSFHRFNYKRLYRKKIKHKNKMI